MDDAVISWDYSHEPIGPHSEETWVEVRDNCPLVCGGLPNIVAWRPSSRTAYRHTPDGRLWKMVALNLPPLPTI